jgi:membrane protease YdiL (CAAX protease family)
MLAWAAPGTLPPGYRFNDPSLAWEATLMPARILHQVLISWLAGPLLEELVFRGLLFRAFERQRGWLYAAVATSVLFGLAHPDRMVASGLGGLVLACVLRRTGSLRACVLLHALYNVLVSWPLLGQVLLSPRSGDLGSPATWALPLACLAFVAVALPTCLWLAARPESCATTGAPAPR